MSIEAVKNMFKRDSEFVQESAELRALSQQVEALAHQIFGEYSRVSPEECMVFFRQMANLYSDASGICSRLYALLQEEEERVQKIEASWKRDEEDLKNGE